MSVKSESRPNIVLILADDLGFADLGVMGSEIRTPHLDRLAQDGMLLTSMYNCARCCPTRASLLTGLYPHRAGIGHMGADLGTPAYQGYLRPDAATIAELLQTNGYRTMMSGKWHVGGDYHARDIDRWRVGAADRPTPTQRGFDRFYGIIDGVVNFFSPHYLIDQESRTIDFADDYYFTDAITDKAIEMVNESVSLEQPFFLYLAHTAPHWPLHAPEEDITRYLDAETYRSGWDTLRQSRHEEMLSRGLLQHNWPISPRDPAAPPWEDATHKRWEADRMAVYAAMVDRMDQSIGRLIDHLKTIEAYDNTLILFLSDNGGCAELMAEDGWAKWFPNRTHDGRQIDMGNRPDLRPGSAVTYMSYDLPWANVSNAPFRLFKHWVHEGGISTPLIAHWPDRIQPGQIRHTAAHVIDLLPTILQVTGTRYPAELNNHALQSLDGESFLSLLQGEDWERERPLFFEHEGNCAIRTGPFKLVRRFDQPWELYDMTADRTELNDLFDKDRARAENLIKRYQHWAESAGVLDWHIALPRLQAAWQMDDIHG